MVDYLAAALLKAWFSLSQGPVARLGTFWRPKMKDRTKIDAYTSTEKSDRIFPLIVYINRIRIIIVDPTF